MSKGKTPAAPDYAAAAREQGQANIDAAIAQNIMGRPAMSGPGGTQTWQQSGSVNVGGREIPTFMGEQKLSPEMQALFDNAVGSAGQPFDSNQVPGVADTAIDRNSVRDALVARQEGAIGRDRDNTRSDLIARGIPEGSEAFNREMDRLDRMTVDARQQAELGAGQAQQQAMQSRSQLIQEALLNRQTPINEWNAMQGGSMMGMPSFGGGQSVQAPDIMGAVQNQYGAEADRANARNQAQASNTNAAASIIAAYLISDRRLKSNVRWLGTHKLGFGIYEYDIFDRHEVGVMADEVEVVVPAAVLTGYDGYKRVCYDMIGGRPHG